ncbi:acyl-CoA dehydrogenase family protein [Actinokineospora bangkokensis]|uniref:Acyl-CoA dehydrogenase n=1 Tax=Actinokineospora bangkokensis TaxID=1193682 RepID=A0A1Q9LJ99_9PSEU|nr:acyl-CoA dehydrogenase family protein [Actinokineospora bangkokensis]OLR92127.1 acyl-CoA dehydrogenase [Actinokineospora bangkokensis]
MEQWVSVAREVAARLSEDAVQRERVGGDPVAEVALLREAGLLALTVPADLGGHGEGWPTAHAVLAEVAAADASVGHVLGYHYLHLWRLWQFDVPETAASLAKATAAQGWLWAGVANPRDDALALSEDGFTITGRKFFATGASAADRLVVSGVTPAGRKLTVAVDARAPGIRYLGDWDNLGQRMSASGGVEFTGARAEAVLGAQPDDEDPSAPRLSLPALGFQLILSRVLVATGRGALATAARYTREQTRAWPTSGVEHAVDDPHTLAAYGTLSARLDAAELLVDQAARAFDDAAADPALSWERRGELSVRVSAAKVVSSELSVEVANRVFELTGARATAARHGMDRFWRNARTLTLHDPAVYKAAEVGRHLLTGAVPAPSGYS